MKVFIVSIYLAAITIANVLTATLSPINVGPFIVPVGTFFIGVTFIFRDLVQNAIGRKRTYFVIGLALLLSALTSLSLGDTLWIVCASAITFLFSETTDTEVYTRLKLPMSLRVFYSGVVGGILDSVVFVIIGLSPLGANFLPWDAVVYAILGQVIVKTVLQLIGAMIIGIVERRRSSLEEEGQGA